MPPMPADLLSTLAVLVVAAMLYALLGRIMPHGTCFT